MKTLNEIEAEIKRAKLELKSERNKLINCLKAEMGLGMSYIRLRTIELYLAQIATLNWVIEKEMKK